MLLTIIFVLALHLIADFILQPNWVQTYKSRDNSILLLHVTVYSYVLGTGALIVAPWEAAVLYGVVNGLLHFIVDYFTSRIITFHALKIKLPEGDEMRDVPIYEKINIYSLCVLLGIDQLCHQACLLATFPLIATI
jgi:hypothetical protein